MAARWLSRTIQRGSRAPSPASGRPAGDATPTAQTQDHGEGGRADHDGGVPLEGTVVVPVVPVVPIDALKTESESIPAYVHEALVHDHS